MKTKKVFILVFLFVLISSIVIADKWSDYSTLSSGDIADGDTFLLRDVSDTSMAATGTQKQYTWASIKAQVAAYIAALEQTFTNKTFDANGTGNVLKGYGFLTMTRPSRIGSAMGVVSTTVTDTHYGMPSFADDAETNNFIDYFIEVPRDIDTAVDLVAWFKFALGGADTGDHDYIISMVSIADSAAQAGTPANAINLSYTPDGSGADGDIQTAGGDTLTNWRSNVTAGQLWMIRVTRDGDDGTNDTSTVDSYPVELTIRYGFTQ